MSSVLKGNYQTGRSVEATSETDGGTLEERFEREALKRVGGSIAFVSKRKVAWDLKDK